MELSARYARPAVGADRPGTPRTRCAGSDREAFVAAGGLRGVKRLEWNHRDPFDRMLAAQAMIESLVIITGDRAFIGCRGVRTLW